MLHELEVGSSGHEHYDLRPTSDNFLTDLKACLELRLLELRVHIFRATS